MMESRFWHYDSSFDAVGLIRRHECPDRALYPGHYVNYFGGRIDTKFFPQILQEGVESDPVPANWHADIAEFAAALRAVELSGGDFSVIELGCGWGCWLNITGMAARRSGRHVLLQGVEGDTAHIGYAQEAMETNGFDPTQYKLYHGIAAAGSGTALFPRQEGDHWGLAPVIGASEAEIIDARQSGKYEGLPMVSLESLIPPKGHIDLLHMDIQGGEADLVADAIDFIDQHVVYMVIGTHSRPIEGRLNELLLGRSWKLEMDRAAIYHMNYDPPLIAIDGVQGWRNMRLRP